MAVIEIAIFGAREEVERRSRRPKVRARHAARRLARTQASRGSNVTRRLVERKSLREPFKRTLQANAVVNPIRNVWAYAIIFCGHFPDQTYTFTDPGRPPHDHRRATLDVASTSASCRAGLDPTEAERATIDPRIRAKLHVAASAANGRTLTTHRVSLFFRRVTG